MPSSPPRRSRSRSRSRRLAVVGTATAAVAGVAVSAGLVWQASYSAFSARTTTPTNNWTAGTVALANNQSGSAMWTVTNLKPGLSDAKCITVTSSGNLPSAVKLYTTGSTLATTNGLSSAVGLTIEQGSFSGGSTCSTHFVADASVGQLYTGAVTAANINNFGTTKTTYANGVGSWTTAGSASETKVFRFSYSFNPSIGGTPNYTQAQIDAFQAGTAAIGFTWEAQNT